MFRSLKEEQTESEKEEQELEKPPLKRRKTTKKRGKTNTLKIFLEEGHKSKLGVDFTEMTRGSFLLSYVIGGTFGYNMENSQSIRLKEN